MAPTGLEDGDWENLFSPTQHKHNSLLIFARWLWELANGDFDNDQEMRNLSLFSSPQFMPLPDKQSQRILMPLMRRAEERSMKWSKFS